MSAADRGVVEAVARRIALARLGDPGAPFADVPPCGLSAHGVRELERFVVDLTRREVARGEAARRAGRLTRAS